jgi:hypothetical protein
MTCVCTYFSIWRGALTVCMSDDRRRRAPRLALKKTGVIPATGIMGVTCDFRRSIGAMLLLLKQTTCLEVSEE